ncbi:hypothetical protein RhiirC2_787642 [Rhizophagus irregularis]|uniref:Uncharacterized protein n=1 Tax=Rhizophagus irregularis TaxID=588596 RepID=A0A2N1MRT4_9GLOM|nr:hypothetical protein RhiirC2_787642 [Rhizophagus irregularis]
MSFKFTQADKIKKYKMKRLIKYLQKDSKSEGLELDNDFFTKFEKKEVTSSSFLKLTGWDFKEYRITLRQALKLEDYIKRLGLDEDDKKIIRKQKIKGCAFFDLTQEKLERWGMVSSPAKTLAKFAKKYKKKAEVVLFVQVMNTKKELDEVLEKYGIISGDITCISQFILRK